MHTVLPSTFGDPSYLDLKNIMVVDSKWVAAG